MPIIEVPFERIGMDLFVPLSKSGRGHEHILVIVDYATRFPEVVPLRKTSKHRPGTRLTLQLSRHSQRDFDGPVAARIQFKTLMLAYRTTTGSAPTYFHSLLRIYIPSRSLRSASERRLVRGLLPDPNPRVPTYFRVSGRVSG